PARRIKHVPDPIVPLRERLRLPTAHRDSRELDGAAGVRGVREPATVRRPDGAEFVVRRERQLPRVLSIEIKLEQLSVATDACRIDGLPAVGSNRPSFRATEGRPGYR